MALARELASRGYGLILVARRGEVLEELAGELRAQHGTAVEVRAVDLSDPTAVTVLCGELSGREISILANNAGVATFGPLAELDAAYEQAQDWDGVQRTLELAHRSAPDDEARSASRTVVDSS